MKIRYQWKWEHSIKQLEKICEDNIEEMYMMRIEMQNLKDRPRSGWHNYI